MQRRLAPVNFRRSPGCHRTGSRKPWGAFIRRAQAVRSWLVEKAHISPLQNASTHIHPDPLRTRKLLLHAAEISKLIGKVQRAGYTLMPLDMHYKGGRIKLEIGLAKGKKAHDKRASEKEQEAKREAAQAMKKERR